MVVWVPPTALVSAEREGLFLDGHTCVCGSALGSLLIEDSSGQRP